MSIQNDVWTTIPGSVSIESGIWIVLFDLIMSQTSVSSIITLRSSHSLHSMNSIYNTDIKDMLRFNLVELEGVYDTIDIHPEIYIHGNGIQFDKIQCGIRAIRLKYLE